jgi:predicted O-linked N-acetylglucosamine transferase (SPINDLY family)
MNLQLLYTQAVGFHQTGNLREAERLYLQIRHADPGNFIANHLLGVLRFQQGRNAEALDLIAAALKVNPNAPEALSNYGNVLTALRRFEDALAAFDRALAVGPRHAETLTNRGITLWNMQRVAEALASYDEALRLKPNLIEALVSRGNALRHLKRFADALASCDKALATRPDLADALNIRGGILLEMERLPEALVCFDKVLQIRPGHVEALNNRGITLQSLKRQDEALATLDRALAIEPGNARALSNRGIALSHLRRYGEALDCYDKALAIQPGLVEAWNNRGHTLRSMGRAEEALASYDKALAIAPASAKALNSRGGVLSDLKRYDEALACHEQALVIDPDLPAALGDAANAALNLCDWDGTAKYQREMHARLAADKLVVPPLLLLCYDDDAARHLQCAQAYVRDKIPLMPRPLWTGPLVRHDRIRVAYMSSDFRLHPMTSIITELLERHDRAGFEIFAVSLGEDDGSENRARIVAAVDRFIDISRQGNRDVAELLHRLEIDILVDLNGHTLDARPEILSHRPAPVQVSYMGYPGPMGTPFIDYVIADAIVLPFDRQPFYGEKIVHLPDTYWANDTRRPAGETPARHAAGLPEDGFVFCCFNNNRKIAAPVFDAWMRLLAAVPDSVLWLLEDSRPTTANLRAAASARGIAPERLVFAPRAPQKEHLARHRLADLFLDTLPYNAHTTAADALWMGLPVVTCRGEAFAGRVAASLLHAGGLPELVTQTMAEYEALALALARDASRLQALRHRLAEERSRCPLFDTDRFRRHMEDAYARMLEITRRGEPPRGFSVAPLTFH